MEILNTLAPLALLIGLGVVLRRTRFVPPELFRQTNRLVYWIGLPALLFYKTAQETDQAGAAMRIFAVLLGATAGCVVLAYLVAWALRLRGRSVGAFVQGAYRGNLAYVGLPVVLYSLAESLPGGDHSDAMAAVAIAPLIPIYNALAVIVLLVGRGRERSASGWWRKVIVGIVTNPLVLACVAGLLYAQTPLGLPKLVERTCMALGQMSLPLALLSIGATLTLRSLRGSAGPAVVAATIKVAVAPLLGFALAAQLALPPLHTRIALLFLACPTAVMSYVMSEQLGSDGELSAKIVAVSVLGALPALAVILLVT